MNTNSRTKITIRNFKSQMGNGEKDLNLYCKGLLSLFYKDFIKIEKKTKQYLTKKWQET